jgi:hypothetical protein
MEFPEATAVRTNVVFVFPIVGWDFKPPISSAGDDIWGSLFASADELLRVFSHAFEELAHWEKTGGWVCVH